MKPVELIFGSSTRTYYDSSFIIYPNKYNHIKELKKQNFFTYKVLFKTSAETKR